MDQNLLDLISKLQKNAKEAEELIRKIGLHEKPQNSVMMPEMVYIPAPLGETYTPLKGDGVPVPVTAFSIGKYPVTQAEWQAVMGNNPSHFQGENLPHFVNDNLPVESVSWEEAVAFCEKLSDAHGLTGSDRYRLPTEAEWEWAASGGIREDRGVTDDTGWYYDNSGGQTHPVRRRPTASGFTTPSETCVSGRRVNGKVTGLYGAGAGSSPPGTRASRSASGSSPATAPATSAFVSREDK